MKVLLCHNYYQQRGGEDESFDAEARLLEAHGHEVHRHTVHNESIGRSGGWRTAMQSVWNRTSYASVRQLIRDVRPDVMHCTNTFPLLSPSVYAAAARECVPILQSLRNYRLLCPSALLLRNGAVCTECLGRTVAWPGIAHGCYRGSRAASAVVAGMTAIHRLAGTWRKYVDLYFTPTEFARQQFVSAGFAPERIAVKPNFIDPDPGPGDGADGFAVFVGRLSEEKGIATLLSAWSRLAGRIPLKIVGDGPLASQVVAATRNDGSVEWVGARPHAEVLDLVGRAQVLVMPSIWYETFGRTVIEAFARGTPVIASRLGCMAELVTDGFNGRLFRPGDTADLAATVRRVFDETSAGSGMRAAARDTYAAQYTGEINHRLLIELYERACAGSRLGSRTCRRSGKRRATQPVSVTQSPCEARTGGSFATAQASAREAEPCP
jgi:glycosyltransferase involved in cell wall biosynthesis